MRWLLIEMWAYLAIAFVLGMAAYRWVFGGGGGLSAEDLSAELASVRTRYEERERESRRLRARIAELTAQLEDVRREARSAEAEAHAARLEISEIKTAADIAVRAARRETDYRSLDRTSGELFGFEAEAVEPEPEPVVEAPPAPEPEPAPEPRQEFREESPVAAELASTPASPEPTPEPAPEPAAVLDPSTPADQEAVSFMAALREGAPDDLTKIKGIGQKTETALNGLGVYYYSQIADWTDAEVAAIDAKLKFPGRIERDKWRLQARRLTGRDVEPDGGASV